MTDESVIVAAVGAHAAVINAAREFADAQAEWRAELDREHVITPSVARRRAHAMDALVAAVRTLDEQESHTSRPDSPN